MTIDPTRQHEIIRRPPTVPVVIETSEDTAGMNAVAPLGALFVGLALFGLFVWGASHSEQGGQSQQATAQQQQQQAQQKPNDAATTGQSPRAAESGARPRQ